MRLKDILKKAEKKGYTAPIPESSIKELIDKPWKHGSIMFNNPNTESKQEESIHKTIHESIHKPYKNYTQNCTQKESIHKTVHESIHKTVHKNIHKITNENKEKNLKSTTFNFYKIKGIQQDLLFFLYQKCKKNEELTSGDLSKKEISKCLSIKHQSIHNTIQRLVEKGFLIRRKAKYGRNGSTVYKLPKFVYVEIKNHEAQKSKVYTELYTKLYTSPVYSSSNYNNTTTKGKELPETWFNINIEPLKHIGFSINQLKQLYRLKIIEPEVVQESIYHFAYGLKYKQKNFKSDPLNVFIGVLRKGEVWIEEGYKSPQELAQGKLLEQMKKEKEQLKNLQDQSYKLALEDWKEALDKRKKGEILSSKQAGAINLPESVSLNIYFREHVWPAKKKDYLVGV